MSDLGPIVVDIHNDPPPISTCLPLQAIEDEADDKSQSSNEDEEETERRQLSYPPVPVYVSPIPSPQLRDLLTPPGEDLDYYPDEPVLLPEEPFIPNPEPIQFLPQDEELQIRQERVLDWQEKHLNSSLGQSTETALLSTEEIREILDSSDEMDSSSLMKSLRSIHPSNYGALVQEMTISLATLRSQISTLNSISLFGERLGELQTQQPPSYLLTSNSIPDLRNLDLLPLIKKLCTLVGESRSPEAARSLSKLIRGGGPVLLSEPLLAIINSSTHSKRKPPAIDCLTYGLLTFPRDEFDLEKIGEAVSGCLWNPKRRIRQAAIECLAVVAHVLGTGIAMPFLRELIDQNRPSHITTNSGLPHPSGALSARVSRRLLPSLSPVGLVDYGLQIKDSQMPSANQSPQSGYMSNCPVGDGLNPILRRWETGGGAADVLWILYGPTPPPDQYLRSTTGSERSSSKGHHHRRTESSTSSPLSQVPPKSSIGIGQEIISELEDEILHQKRWESIRQVELVQEQLAELRLHELERVYERSIADDDDDDDDDEDDERQPRGHEEEYEGKVGPRDRDSGVSSLKSVRVVSPCESSSSKSPIPDGDASHSLTLPISTPPPVENAEPFGIVLRRPVLPRSTRSSITTVPDMPPNHRARVVHSPPPSVPPLSTSASSILELSEWHKSASDHGICRSKVQRKAKSTSREGWGASTSSRSTTHLPITSRAHGDNSKHNLTQSLAQLSAPEWETNVDGFVLLTRLLRHHPEIIRAELVPINRSALLHLSNLRTQVTRAACLFFADLFGTLGKSMEHDCDKIAEKLLDKTADTNKFIRDASLTALEAMVKNLNPTKTIQSLEGYGAKHRNSIVRSTTAQVMRVLVEQMGPERTLNQHSGKVLPILVKFLQEGSLETRTHAKMALSTLVGHGSFETSLKRSVPSCTLKNVEKTISSIKNDLIRKG